MDGVTGSGSGWESVGVRLGRTGGEGMVGLALGSGWAGGSGLGSAGFCGSVGRSVVDKVVGSYSGGEGDVGD